MADSIIFTLPEESRPKHIERYVVPVNDDGSLHLDNIHFRAEIGEEPPANHYLAIYGDRYNGLPGLFNIFSDQTQEDVWLRFTWLNSIRAQRAAFVIGLVFEEWINDTYYSGGTPSTIWGTNAIQICVNLYLNRGGLGEDYSSEIINDLGSSFNSGMAAFGSGLGTDPVIDLHITRTGFNGSLGGTWDSEVYVDNTLRYTANHGSDGDAGHPIGRTGIGGMVISTQYASYSSTYVPLDDIMVGTTQGASDLMSVANFESGYSPLDNSLDGSPPSFDILAES